MLVLSRKEGDRILIGDEIELTILKNNSGRVKIGIRAPEEISVRRHELVTRENQTGAMEIEESTRLCTLS